MSFLDTAATIAVLIVVGFLGTLFVWTFWAPDLTAAQRDVVVLLVGALASQLGTVTQYFFNRDRQG